MEIYFLYTEYILFSLSNSFIFKEMRDFPANTPVEMFFVFFLERFRQNVSIQFCQEMYKVGITYSSQEWEGKGSKYESEEDLVLNFYLNKYLSNFILQVNVRDGFL